MQFVHLKVHSSVVWVYLIVYSMVYNLPSVYYSGTDDIHSVV